MTLFCYWVPLSYLLRFSTWPTSVPLCLRAAPLTPSPSPPLPSDDCVRGRGRYYQGRVNTTAEGILCQRWDLQYPQEHRVPVDLFPELAGAENYCRNAGGEEPGPWCFTTDPAVRWRPCDIPRCGELLQGSGDGCGQILSMVVHCDIPHVNLLLVFSEQSKKTVG